MARIGDPIYQTTTWRRVREAYYRERHGLCERCDQPGDVVHHKVHLTSENIHDPAIAFGHENLELLCHVCHNKLHKEKHKTLRDDVRFDEHGNLVRAGGGYAY